MGAATAVETRQLVRANQVVQIEFGAYVAGLVAEVFELLRTGRISPNEFPAAHLTVERFGHEQAALMMARFIEEYREAAAPDQVHARPLLAAFDADAAYGRAKAALDQVTVLDATQVGYDRQFKEIAEQFSVRAARHVLNAGRDTMVFSTAANGTRWRRVTDGNPCAFCAMLATRSDYRTRESALYVVGQSARARGSRSLGERYHDRCGCTVAEVVGPWEPNDAERGHADLYGRALEACEAEGLPRTTGNLLAKMRELGDGVVHDAHKPPETDFSTLGPSLWRWLEHLTEIELD